MAVEFFGSQLGGVTARICVVRPHFLIAAALALGSGLAPATDWIWMKGDGPMSHEFELAALPEGAVELRAIGDFCRFSVELNGTEVLHTEPYDDAAFVAVKPNLVRGVNRIAIAAEAVAGPAAVALELIGADGTLIAATSKQWAGSRTKAPLGILGFEGARFEDVDAFAEYNQWKEAKAGAGGAKFPEVPKGFELERLHVAKPDEGSWVSMVFDPQGRLILAREKKGLIRFDTVDGQLSGDPAVIDDTLLECRGLLFVEGTLYANANNSKQLFRLRPKGDAYAAPEPVMASGGGVGHGRNDLALGPKGKIYAIHGDSVKPPDGVRSLVPSPHSAQPAEGHLVRLHRIDGRRELVCAGLRNPFGVAFNADGEPFTYDADNEGDVGLPFYRPARVNHLVSGADYGWRQGSTRSWPVYAPDSLPTTFDLGRGSPTAVCFGSGSKFPQRYRQALFVLDWAYGRIIALDVVARGASYTCRAHTFLQGRPLNVTDLCIGPDGAMYFVTGGRGTQSALYRLRFVGGQAPPQEPSAQVHAREQFSSQARNLRRRLESFHRPAADAPLDLIFEALDSADPWIRHAALIALQHQPVERWRERASQGNLAVLLALVRLQAEPPKAVVSERLGGIRFGELSRINKLTVLSIVERTEGTGIEHVRDHFPDADPAVNRELARLLVREGAPGAVDRCVELLTGAESQFDRLYYLELLSGVGAGWTPAAVDAFFSALRHPDYFRGDRNIPAFLKTIRKRAIDSLPDTERERLGDLVHPANPAAAGPLPKPGPVVEHWAVPDLLGVESGEFTEERGWNLFERALCSRCHQLRGRGNALGPDLSHVSSRFSRRDLVTAIVQPSQAMAEIFRNIIVTKKDGSVIVGRVVRDDFRGSTISLSTNPFEPGKLTTVSKHDIAARELSPASPMPAGLLDQLTKEEAAVLIEFVMRGGR